MAYSYALERDKPAFEPCTPALLPKLCPVALLQVTTAIR
jgi:hypothetical protein